MRFIDLSAVISATPADAPPFERRGIAYADHAAGAAQVEALFHVPRELLRDGEGWATETLSLMTHNTTHVDAPWHYNSRIAGRTAAAIDELPLEWFFSDGVVVDMTHKADGEAVGVTTWRRRWRGSATASSRWTSSWSAAGGISAAEPPTTCAAAAA